MQTYSFYNIFLSMYSLFTVLFWVLLPIALFLIFWNIRLVSKRMEFLKNVKWDMLEIHVGEQNFRTPKAMQQVFASLYGIYSFGIGWTKKYLDGVVDLWVSFEMVGKADGIHFYVRVPSDYRNLLESALYSQYPDIEIVSAEDYVFNFGKILPNDLYDLWGTGFKLSKNSVYPIRTYEEFEEVKEEKIADPLSTIFEAMSKVKNDETICIQLMISPTGAATGNDTKKLAEEEIKKMIENKGMKRINKDGEEEGMSGMSALTPGLQDVVKAIEHKSSQLAFEFSLRFLYIDRKDKFNGLNIASIMGSLQQFNSQSTNSFRSDSLKTGFGGWLAMFFPSYKKAKVFAKKRRLFEYYSSRHFGLQGHLREEKISFLNSEELATIFHFPRSFMKAPGIKGAYSRKGGAPSNLPVD